MVVAVLEKRKGLDERVVLSSESFGPDCGDALSGFSLSSAVTLVVVIG